MNVLDMLLRAFPDAVSGEEMARILSLSRSAIWKRIQSLQRQGLEISGKQNSGYSLQQWPDLLLPELMEYYRRAADLGKQVHYQYTVDSTNNWAKELARQGAAHGTLVVAEEQTAGRGRRGRDWLSAPHSGIFASLIIRPNLAAERVPLLTLTVGIALAQALHSLGLPTAWLKWPNDIWVGRRKMAGILSELSGQVDHIDWVVVGMGINTLQTDFPPELATKATSFLQETGLRINRAKLLAEVLGNLEDLLPLLENPELGLVLDKWRSYDRLSGQEVQVITPSGAFYGRALGVTADGALIVRKPDGQEQTVLAGDVSLRI